MDANDVRRYLATSPGWFKSSYSAGQNGCVELNFSMPGWVGVRDSKLGDVSPILAFVKHEWEAFLSGVKDDQFDL